MKQMPMFKRQPTVLSKRKAADSGNLAMARLILTNPELYEGLQALWAHRVLEKDAEVQALANNRVAGLK